jgi:hypothetical protein
MSQRFYSDPLAQGVGYPVIGDNSAVFNYADAVFIDTDGFLDTATTSSKIMGFCIASGPLTMTSDNETVAMVCPQYVYSDNVQVIYPAASSVFSQTLVGSYFVFSGTTSGAFTMNITNSDTVGQFQLLGFNPDNDGTTTDGVFRVALDQRDVSASS